MSSLNEKVAQIKSENFGLFQFSNKKRVTDNSEIETLQK